MKVYKVKSGLLDRQRSLMMTDDLVEWESGDLKRNQFTRLNKADIVDFKHGHDWIVWYRFTVGRQFSITIKDKRNRELKIRFTSYFGLHPEYIDLYAEMVDDIWRLYHSDIVDRHLDILKNSGELEIQGIKLSESGIQLRGQQSVISWDNLNIKEYYSYFAVFHQETPELHSRVSYNEYGTEILWSMLKNILKHKEAKDL
jgi:hypothetical protein